MSKLIFIFTKHSFTGDLMNEDQLLGWLLHQKKHSEIPEVTDEMMEKLIESTPYLAVLFCKSFIMATLYISILERDAQLEAFLNAS